MAQTYPDAERQPIEQTLHGHRVADPYRWLEDTGGTAEAAWSEAEDRLWAGWAGAHPEREPLADELLALVPGVRSAPVVVGPRQFWTERAPGQDHAVLFVADGAGRRALVDPNAIDPEGKVTLDGWAPSLEGDRLAYLLSSGGDEESRLWVIDVADSRVVDGPVDRLRYSPLGWLPGGEELFYARRLAPDAVPEGEGQFHRRVWRHRVGADPATDELVFGGEGRGPDVDKTAYLDIEVAPDGSAIAVAVALGTAPRNDLYVARIEEGSPLDWQPVLVDVDAQAFGHWDRAGALWLLTDLEAPRRRLVRVDPADPRPERWVEVVGEDAEGGVLESFVLAGERVVVLWSRHALSAVSVHARAWGEHERDVTLPGPGTADLTGRRDEGDEIWLGWTTYTEPYSVARLDLATGTIGAALDIPGGSGSGPSRPSVHAEQVTFRSADGTQVRMTVISREGTPSQPGPTVLYGYGGFNIALTPAYSSTISAWVAAGGVWAVANLRGGSEEGEAWHRDGMREHKHHVFEDFEAAADTLVERGWTTPAQLGIMGGSNGGLLVGAALTRSPERYRAVICSAPLLDMVRYERFGLGTTWNDEYGTAADPTELGWLLSYSPYHHVHQGIAYPATLFTVFDHDTRVDPLHARKLCAALQWATTGDPLSAPVLLRREADVGHGARSVRRTVQLSADELAFLAAATGLRLAGG